MKRFLSILLLAGFFLPVVFESCKKPEGDPVTPGNPAGANKPGANANVVDARYLTFVHSAQEPNSTYGGVLISTLHIYTFDDKGILAGMTGTYLSYTKVNKAALDNALTTLLADIVKNEDELKASFTLTDYMIARLRKLPDFESVYTVNQEQVQKLLRGQEATLAKLTTQPKAFDEWLASRASQFLTDLVATPAYAQRRAANPQVGAIRTLTSADFSNTDRRIEIEKEIKCFRDPQNCREILRPQFDTGRLPGTPTQGSGVVHLGTGWQSYPPADIDGLRDITGNYNYLGGSNGATNGPDAASNQAANTNWENPGPSDASGLPRAVDDFRNKLKEWEDEFNRRIDNAKKLLGLPKGGNSSGDPHLLTLDRLKYDFQAVGEFVLTKSTTDKFEIQVRQANLLTAGYNVSFNTAVAVNTGGDVLFHEARKGIFLNGQELANSDYLNKNYALPKGGSITRDTWGNVLITTANKDEIGFFDQSQNLNLFVTPADTRKGKLKGLLGNFDGSQSNDGQTADGKAVNVLRRDELYSTFADSWRIKQAESLMLYQNGQTTETYTDRSKPSSKDPYAGIDLVARQRAEAICRKAGVNREPELSNCILDVATSGDESFAAVAALMASEFPTDNNFQLLADFSGKSSRGAVGLSVGDKIYAGLGSDQIDWAMYDPTADKWTPKTPFPGGKSSYARISAFTIGTKIYCVGGIIDGTMTNALWEYDTATDKWTRRKDVPGAARFNIASFALHGKGYALFGTIGWGNVGDFPTNSTVYEYNPVTDSWTQRGDFPGKPRGNNVISTEFNGMVMVINGRPFLGGGSGGGAPGNDWYEYIPARDVWEKRANSVFDDGQYFSVGTMGYLIRGNTLFSYNATADAWSKSPGKEIYLPLTSNILRGIKQAPVLNGKAYIGLGYGTNNVGIKEWWSFTP